MHKSCFIWYFLEYLKLLFNQLIQRRLWINPDGVNGARNSYVTHFHQLVEKIDWCEAKEVKPRPLRTDFLPSVHLRPPFQISNVPSSESVYEVYGLSSSAVHFRPSRTKNHSLSNSSMSTAMKKTVLHTCKQIIDTIKFNTCIMLWRIQLECEKELTG